MSEPKEYWWVSVGGNDCEPAIVVGSEPKREIFTFGCPDALTTKDAELVQEIGTPPDTPKEAARKQLVWDKKCEADRKRGIIHGYRKF